MTGGLLWANIVLLFTLSLVPFSTAYLGDHHFSRDATQLYLVTMLLPALAYAALQAQIRRTGHASAMSDIYHRATTRKGFAAIAVYGLGIPLSHLSPWLGISCAALVALFWVQPWSALDRLFLRCDVP